MDQWTNGPIDQQTNGYSTCDIFFWWIELLWIDLSCVELTWNALLTKSFVTDLASICAGINAPNFWGAWGSYSEILKSVRRLCEKVVRGWLQELLSELTTHSLLIFEQSCLLLPVEALVETQSGENRRAAGRGKPRRLLGSQGRGSRIGSLSYGTCVHQTSSLFGMRKEKATCKEVFGQSGQLLQGCGNPCWGWYG